jgi:hypothetical protein
MPEYLSSLVGTVSDRRTKKGKEQRMEQLSRTITAQAPEELAASLAPARPDLRWAHWQPVRG